MDMSKSKNIAIAVSDFNSSITGRMLASAQAEAKVSGASIIKVIHVPGAMDLPLVAALLLEREDIDALVTLGCIIKGETGHDELIAGVCAKQLSDMSIEFGKPVGFGVIGPKVTQAQANVRADDYAKRAVQAALHLLKAQEEAQE